MRRVLGPLVQALGALIGGVGVAFAAYASHGTTDTSLAAPAAAILLAHGPALLAVSIIADRSPRLVGSIGCAMALGVLIFSGDLAARIWLGDRLFSGAAPLGGGLIILSWAWRSKAWSARWSARRADRSRDPEIRNGRN